MQLCAVQSYSETEYDLIVYDTSVQVLTLNWTLTRFIHLWLSGCLRTMPHLFLFDWLTLTRAALYKIGTAQLIWKRPPLFGSPVLSKVSALKVCDVDEGTDVRVRLDQMLPHRTACIHFAWFDLAIADIPLKCIDFVGINARLDEPSDRTLYENLTSPPDLPFC